MSWRESRGGFLHGWRYVLAAVLSLVTATASGALVGDAKALDPVLGTLVSSLHENGIDVVGGDTAALPLGQRPRVARLSGVPIPQDGTSPPSAPWMRQFLEGAVGFVAAVKPALPPTTAPSTADEFMARWNAAPREKRVFLSFTSADAHHAQLAANALREQGYVTFTFLNAGDSAPRYDAGTVGSVFANAGHHFVVDTPNARKSHGVWLESLTLARLPNPPQSPRGPSGSTPPQPPDRPPGSPLPPNEPLSPDGRGPPSKPRSPSGESRPHSEIWEILDREQPTTRPMPSVDDLKRGIRENHWIVTRNPETPNKLFVHRTQDEHGFLRDPLYVIKVERNGAWSVHEPKPTVGGIGFGRRVGRTPPPAKVTIGRCGCI